MMQIVARWLGPRKLRVLGDSAYAGGSIRRHVPAHVDLISRMTMNAVLYALPPTQTAARGRCRKKGARLSSPLQMAQDPRGPGAKASCTYMGARPRFCISP